MVSRFSVLVFTFFFTILVFSCMNFKSNYKKDNNIKKNTDVKDSNSYFNKPQKGEDNYKFPVIVTRAIKGVLSDYISLNGDIDTKIKSEIFPDIEGRIISLNVKLGSYVKKGQIIAIVDPSRPGNIYLESPVRASISGYIIGIKVKAGQKVTTQTGIAIIGSLDKKIITTFVSEKYISKIKVGSDAIFELDAYPDEKFLAKISEVSPVVDFKSRTIEVRLVPVGKNTNKLIIGMFTKIKIVTEFRSNVVKIPIGGVVERKNKLFIFRVNKEKEKETVSMIPLLKDFEVDDIIAVKEGIKDGDLIVVEGMSSLSDGAKVRIIDTIESLDIKNNI